MALLGAMAEAGAAPLFSASVAPDPTAAWPLRRCLPMTADGPCLRDGRGRLLLQVHLVRAGFGSREFPYAWSVELRRWRYGRGRLVQPSLGPYRFTSREWMHADEAQARAHAARIGAAIERRASA